MRPGSAPGPRPRRSTTRVALECLEDRTLPSAVPLAALVPDPRDAHTDAVVRRVEVASVDAASAFALDATVQTAATNPTLYSSSSSPTLVAVAAGTVSNGSPNGTTPNETGSSPQGQVGASEPTGSPNTPTPLPAATAAALGETSAPGSTAGAGNPPGQTESGTNASPNSSTGNQQSSGNAEVNDPDSDPIFQAILSRALPGLGSGLLGPDSGRPDALRQDYSRIAEEDPSTGAEPLGLWMNGIRDPAGGGGGTACGFGSDSVPGSPVRMLFPLEGALGYLSFTGFSNSGALRSQGIDFQPLNGSGVGVVGTVLAGVEAGSEEGANPAGEGANILPAAANAGGPAAAEGLPSLARRANEPSPDVGLKQFLLGLDPAAVPAAPDRDAPVVPAAVPGGVEPAPALTAVPPPALPAPEAPLGLPQAAIDAAGAEGSEADRAMEARPEGSGKWTGPIFFLLAPVLFLYWQPDTASRKPHTGAPGPPKRRP
jgi:hypothetical protein